MVVAFCVAGYSSDQRAEMYQFTVWCGQETSTSFKIFVWRDHIIFKLIISILE